MKIAVFGATGGTGRAVIATLLEGGHQVTAFARDPAKLDAAPGLTVLEGDVMNAASVAPAVAGQDGVVVSLGNSQNAVAMRLGAKRHTPTDVCEVGTRHIIGAMQAASVARLVCVTAFGVGDTRDILPPMYRLFYRLLLSEHMADKENQERLVKASGLDWTLVQPVGLRRRPGDGNLAGEPVRRGAQASGQPRGPGRLHRRRGARGPVCAPVGNVLGMSRH